MTRPLLPQHNRYDYVPLTERRDYSWPDGKRLAFVITSNVEWFAFGAGLGHDPAKIGEPQTHRNYAWRDYGNRIGIWRLFDLLDELKLPAGHCTNSLIQPFRLRRLRSALKHCVDSARAWLCRPGAIADHCLSLGACVT